MKRDLLINILYVIVFMVFSWVPMKRALHMFQQNRYEQNRYLDWIKSYLKTMSTKNIIPVGILLGLLIIEYVGNSVTTDIICTWALCLWACVLIYQEIHKIYIKPLVFTDRVKRQVIVMTILNLIWICGLLSFKIPFVGVGMIVGYLGTWVLILVMDVITNPIEKMVKRKYLNQAKSILQGQHDLIKIGITGSFGKTSSKNILQEILSEKMYSLMTPASFNTPMGITITIREMLKPIHEVFICEMGADHVNDIKELCDFVSPKIGLVTSIGPQHLNTFGTLDNIINEKMKLIESLPKDGVGIINKDNEYIRSYTIKNNCRLVSYGIHEVDVDYHAKDIEYTPKGSKFTVVSNDGEYLFETKLLGEHNIANILAAIAIARELNIGWTELQSAVKKVKYIEHRLELKKINGYTFIDNAFNSNPIGSAMSLQVLKMMPNKRFIITPGMIDLGSKQDEINCEFGRKMKDCADEVILVGIQQTKPIVQGLQDVDYDMNKVHVCKTVREAFELVYKLATPIDTILLENDLPDAFNK